MKFLKRNSPDLALTEAANLLDTQYGVTGDFLMLESERDQNFRVDTENISYLFKICNADEDESVVDLQIQALKHIERVDPTFPVPRSVPTLTGDDKARIETADGASHVVRLMSFLDGVVADRPEYDTPEFRYNTGAAVARLDRALRGFFHPAANQDHPWDLMRVPRLLDQVDHISDEGARRSVVAILEQVRDHTIPACLGLRHQLIHQDVYTSNLVVHPGNPAEIAGIIDFGDMVYGPLIAEIAVAADPSGRPNGAAEALIDIVLGYDSVTPLETAEVDVLYDLVLARLAMGTTIVAARAGLFPDESHYGSDQELLWERIASTVAAAPGFTDEIKRVLGLSRQHGTDLATQRTSLFGENSPHFYVNPLHVVAAKGMWMDGSDGRRYLDFYNNVPTVGHNHPQVVNAVSRQLATLNTNTRYLYSPAVEYAERLTVMLDHDLDVCLFVNSGSEANDVASQILKHRSKANRLLVMEGAYHGLTEAALAITDADSSGDSNVITLAPPDSYRGRANSPEIEDIDGLAGFFVDPALTSNGIPTIPQGFLATVSDAVRSQGGLVVADEVQTGFGRTGVMWGHQHQGFVPDLVTLGKPVGNGVPLGVVVTRREILDEFMADSSLFSTFGGNPVSCAAGLAVLDVIEREHLVENSAVVGRYLRDSLRGLSEKNELVGDVRGSGLLVGLELVTDRDTKTPATAATKQLIELMRIAGVLVGAAGGARHILKLRPPLIAQHSHVDHFIEALEDSMARL